MPERNDLSKENLLSGTFRPISQSSEPGGPTLDDCIPHPLGLSMKFYIVPREMYEVNPAPPHDIEFNSTPALGLADAKITKELLVCASSMVEIRRSFTGNWKFARILISKRALTMSGTRILK
jgi:hypothetical protein